MQMNNVKTLERIRALAKQAVLNEAQVAELCKEFYQDLACMTLIEAIRSQEGWCIEIIGDNPDFGGPNCIVEVFGEWKDAAGKWLWREERFTGDNLMACLTAAHERISVQAGV